jgi:type I restriction enzyme S subunit
MIRLRFSLEINPFYAAAFLNSPYGRLQSERQSNGAVQLNINLEEINRILMPVPALKDQSVIAKHWQDYNFVLDKSVEFIHEAEADVEALIEGRLDVEGILAGRIQPPTWEDIEV